MERELFLKRLYDENAVFLIRLCRKRTNYDPACADMVDACVQETFLAAFKACDTLAAHPNPRGWLVQTCLYRLMDAMAQERKRREQVAFSLDSGQAEKLPGEDTLETHSARQNLRSFFAVLLALLTPEEKAVFTAYFLEQQTMRDIAAAQQLTENQVKGVIRRIRRRAKKLFEENFS